MKNLSLRLEKSLLSRDEMRFISGGDGNAFIDDGSGPGSEGCMAIQKCNWNSECRNPFCNRCIASPFPDEAGYCAT